MSLESLSNVVYDERPALVLYFDKSSVYRVLEERMVQLGLSNPQAIFHFTNCEL